MRFCDNFIQVCMSGLDFRPNCIHTHIVEPFFIIWPSCLFQDIPVGLETGICRMKKGERAELTVDPKYGFGKDGLKSKVGFQSRTALTFLVNEVEIQMDKIEQSIYRVSY